jgi:hypothetical protein
MRPGATFVISSWEVEIVNKRMAAGAIAALLLTTGLTGARDSSASSGIKGIEGTWQVTVHRENPPAGQPADIEALVNYAAGGTLTESSNSGILRRTVGYGEWKRIGERLYASSHISFQFNPTTGAFTGTARLDRKVLLSPDGTTFVGVARLSVFDAAGSLVVADLRTTEFGRALEIEVIDDVP